MNMIEPPGHFDTGKKFGIDHSSPPDAAGDPEKQFATLRARLALAGYTLTRTAPGDGPQRLYVCRWGLVKELGDVAAAERFAAQVGAPG